MFRLSLLALIAAFALSGCAAIGALNQASAPLDVFQIRAPQSLPVARGRPQGIDFIVEPPAASGVIDTDRILVRPNATQIQYLPDARWSETAPAMLQTALVEGFERTGAFSFVGRRPLSTSGDVALVSNLTEFHAEIPTGAAAGTVRMTIIVRMVRESDTAILASRSFSRTVAVPDTGTPAIIAGFDAAAQEILRDLTLWVLASRGVPVGAS